MLPAHDQNKQLLFLYESVINICADYEKFLTEC